jgi:hypothetical protein
MSKTKQSSDVPTEAAQYGLKENIIYTGA